MRPFRNGARWDDAHDRGSPALLRSSKTSLPSRRELLPPVTGSQQPMRGGSRPLGEALRVGRAGRPERAWRRWRGPCSATGFGRTLNPAAPLSSEPFHSIPNVAPEGSFSFTTLSAAETRLPDRDRSCPARRHPARGERRDRTGRVERVPRVHTPLDRPRYATSIPFARSSCQRRRARAAGRRSRKASPARRGRRRCRCHGRRGRRRPAREAALEGEQRGADGGMAATALGRVGGRAAEIGARKVFAGGGRGLRVPRWPGRRGRRRRSRTRRPTAR